MNENNVSEPCSGSFASEFEKYLNSGHLDELKVGNIVEGTVVAVNKETVSVDIGFKSSGVIRIAEFADINGKVSVKCGDKVDVMIVTLENESNQIVLSREKAYQKKIWDAVENAFKNDEILHGRIVQKVKGGLQVDIGIPAFLPGSQIDIRPHRNLDKFLGEEFDFKVLKITKEKGNIVLSRRAVLMSERDQLRGETLKVLSEGVVMEGTVKNITDYGAFIDLGGIDGLLHITDISWGRVNHPAEKLSVGQVVPVVVLKYDPEKERVSLGMKQLSEDPWLSVDEKYLIGNKVQGKVVNTTDYGVFVELEEGIEGLVHVSDMSWTKKVRNPSKVYSEGTELEAVVLGIDTEQQRINLGLKQLTPNPWDSLHERHPVGSKVHGKVRSIVDFGIFIGVEDGIDGLVHVSDFSWTKKIKDPKEIQELFKKGDEVDAIVLDIDVENERLSLGIKQLEADPWDTISQRYPVGSKVKGTITSIADFGVFVEVEEGVEGLIHTSQLGLEKDQSVSDVFHVGDVVEPDVTNVDRDERRISLSLRSGDQRDEVDAGSEFIEDKSAPITFGDLLREKMENK
ncbi:MAG: 30S ribosomal protein S1 [Bdellovibrionota bacterium]|jgi:small subunit ribosomal protein S1